MIFEYFRTRLRATLMRFRIGPNELRKIIHANEEFMKNNDHEGSVLKRNAKKSVSESDDNDAGLRSVFVEDAVGKEDEKTQRKLLKMHSSHLNRPFTGLRRIFWDL